MADCGANPNRQRRKKNREHEGYCYPPIPHAVDRGDCAYPQYHKPPCYCRQSSKSKYSYPPPEPPIYPFNLSYPQHIPPQHYPPPMPPPCPPSCPPSCPPPCQEEEQEIVKLGSAPPTIPPKQGEIYFDLTTSMLYVGTGTAWIVSSSTIVNNGPPSNPGTLGQTYFDSKSHIFYVYTFSGWVTSATAIMDTGEGSPSMPGTQIGQLYYDSDSTYTYLWIGDSWELYLRGLESTDANGNVIIGRQSETNGGNNTFVGAEIQHPAGDNNIAIGFGCKFVSGTSNSINIGGQNSLCPPNSVLIGNIQSTTQVAGMLLDRRNIFDANGQINPYQIKGGIFNMIGDCQLPSGSSILSEYVSLPVGATIRMYFKNSTNDNRYITSSSSDVTILGGDPNIEVISKQTREVLLVYGGGTNFVLV